jgi:hypothetical protein
MDQLFGLGYGYGYGYPYCCPTDSNNKNTNNCNPWFWMANYNWPADTSSWMYGDGDNMQQYLAYAACCNTRSSEKINVLTKLISPSTWPFGATVKQHFTDGNFLNHLPTATINFLYDELYTNRDKNSPLLTQAYIGGVLQKCIQSTNDPHYSVLLACLDPANPKTFLGLTDDELATIPGIADPNAFRGTAILGTYYGSASAGARSYYGDALDDDILAPRRHVQTYRPYRPTNYYGSTVGRNYYD